MTDNFERLKITDAKPAHEIGKLLCIMCGLDPNEVVQITVTASAGGSVEATFVKRISL